MAGNAFLYDGSLCIACRGCQVACKQWNYLPGEKTKFFAREGGYQNPADLSPITWNMIKFNEVVKDGKVEWLFRRHHCFHCTDASCLKACPVEPKALTRHPVFQTQYVDQDRCIGCGSCVEACPFGVPHVDESLGKTRKCTGCFDRVANGLLPACAKTCPTKAITYGAKEDIYRLATARVATLKQQGIKADLYGTKQLGGLRSLYVLPEGLKYYDLPENPQVPKDLGLLHELIHATPGIALTAAVVGAAIARLRDLRKEMAEEEA